MTTETLSPTPKQRFYGNNGAPLASGLLFTYAAGTTTKATTYTSSTGLSTNTNPIVLNARGECDLWIPPNVAFKYTLAPAGDTDPPTNPIFTVDQIVNSQLITLYGGVDTGVANAYALNFTASFTAYVDGIVIYWIAAHTNTGASTLNVNGLGVAAIVNQDLSALGPSEIQANQTITVMYKGGQWLLIAAGSVPYSGTFTATATGLTTAPTGTAYWTKIGNQVTLVLPNLNGTSNSVNFTFTGLPASLWPPTVGQTAALAFITNNGAQTTGGGVMIQPGTGTITFTLLGAAGGFTNVLNKGIGGQPVITYLQI